MASFRDQQRQQTRLKYWNRRLCGGIKIVGYLGINSAHKLFLGNSAMPVTAHHTRSDTSGSPTRQDRERVDATSTEFVQAGAASISVLPQTQRPLGKTLRWLVVGLVLCLCHTGCVQRRMTIRSNPPGALVYVDDQPTPIGTTPVSHDFIYYGTRKIRLIKDGYETLTVMQPIRAPWYQYLPFDFVAENFVPGQIRDQRTMEFQLRPQSIVPTEQLLSRAEELRRGVHATAGVATAPEPGGVRSPAAMGPPTFPPPAEVIPTPQGIGGQPVYPLP